MDTESPLARRALQFALRRNSVSRIWRARWIGLGR
jgi:hypothetical protein